MTTLRQIEANRRNARLSTGPVTEEGKRRSRQNAVRHGLTAETVIAALEDADDYAEFQMAVTSDYDVQTAVERELVLRLASLLWRLRRATAIETGLFKVQALQLLSFRQRRTHLSDEQDFTRVCHEPSIEGAQEEYEGPISDQFPLVAGVRDCDELTTSFLRLANLPTCPLDRLSRYEATLWRQACQILFTLHTLNRRRPWERTRLR